MILGIITYFALNKYVDKNLQTRKIEKQLMEEPEKAVGSEDGLRSESEKEYAKCMNKAYQDYMEKYNQECEKNIMDGECQISQEALYGLQGYYEYDKKQCEKLFEP